MASSRCDHYFRTFTFMLYRIIPYSLLSLITMTALLPGCGEPVKELSPPPIAGVQVNQVPQKQVPKPPLPPPPPPSIPERERVIIVEKGVEKHLRYEDALAQGYTVVDLRDQWTPLIFQTYQNTEGELLEHPYREIFVGLANDRGDNEGQPLEDEEFNYLEVFGIPPSIGVIKKRYDHMSKPCYQEIDYQHIKAVKSMRFGSASYQKKQKKRVKEATASVNNAMQKLMIDTYDELLKQKPNLKDEVKLIESALVEKLALENIEKRLECEEHQHPRYNHKAGRLDQGLRMAIRRFQRKHKLYEYANLKSDTIDALAKPALLTNYESFRRSLEERVIAAAGILEDGSVNQRKKPPTYLGKDGQEHEVRNLVKEFTDALMVQLDLDSPEKANAFFARHPLADFKWMRVGFKAPPYPEYYASHMDFDIVVDRGDVWYDPPFDSKGKKIKQHRKRLPKFKLYATYQGKRFQLIHWPTTIGGWRTEIANNGHEYYKYKNSDVGSRVIRNVISGPVWIPPKSTPLKSLSKRRYVNGRAQNIVNYEEMGPGYLSAYGLAAGYFVIPRKNGRDLDRGIRAHGSSDFMSILSPERFSHGCHRLKNDLAVRFYGYLLKHRNHIVQGDQKIKHERQFLLRDEIYEIRVLSRGFLFEMTPPIAVEVLEGNVLGNVKKPIEEYVAVPGHVYPSGAPDDSPVPEELQGGTESTIKPASTSPSE